MSAASSSSSPPLRRPKLHIYVIHTLSLKGRIKRLTNSLNEFSTVAATGFGYELCPQTITLPSTAEIEATAATFQSRAKLEPVGDADYDRHLTALSAAVLSNFEKHREVWRRIVAAAAAAAAAAAPGDLYAVFEDDMATFPGTAANLAELFGAMAAAPAAGGPGAAPDAVFLGMSDPATPPTAPFAFVSAHAVKVLPCKEAYILRNPAVAKMLLEETEEIRFPARIQMSRALHQHRDRFQIAYPNKRITIEGSKVGYYTSSLHPNNLLVLNAEYMRLFEMMQAGNYNLKEIREVYKPVAQMRIPDLMHLMGVILFKAGAISEAETMMSDAVSELVAQDGVVNARSDALNNAINVYEHLQSEAEKYLALPSKYKKDSALAGARGAA